MTMLDGMSIDRHSITVWIIIVSYCAVFVNELFVQLRGICLVFLYTFRLILSLLDSLHKNSAASLDIRTQKIFQNGGTMPREINPKDTTRAMAFEFWMKAPNPMVTFFKTMDVTNLVRISRRNHLKFNMLLTFCIGKAAAGIKEFYILPVDDKLIQYDAIAVNTIVKNKTGEVSSCDLPFSENLEAFNLEYLAQTAQVAETCQDRDLSETCMVIGTSAIVDTEIDGAVGMNSGIFNNPFLIWGKYRKKCFRYHLPISFQFHHTQMDGAHAGRFLENLQNEINRL